MPAPLGGVAVVGPPFLTTPDDTMETGRKFDRFGHLFMVALFVFGASVPTVAGEGQQATANEPPATPASAGTAEELAFFESKIRPVLVEHCHECHSASSKIIQGGLLLDSRSGIRAGGDSGPGIVPGDQAQSLVLAAIRHETFEMPPDRKLPDSIIADFEAWVMRGAADPREQPSESVARKKGVDWEAARNHWAFRPIADPRPPAIDDPNGWVENPIDQFVLQTLSAEGMKPAPRVDKWTLIRRATFDLTGLPPTPEEVEAFLADPSPDAYPRLIERLLQSPHYGERWGRHWLDVVRYADSNGADENHDLPTAWRYRDWVVRMFNRDLPFDQFVIQQLAGDMLPTPADEQEAGDLLTATGMLVIGPKMLAEQDKDKMIIDIVDEQIDTVTRTLFGMTVACARCHDHKFDPISSEDYYALAGIFYSTKTMADRAFVSNWMERPLPSAEITAKRAEYQPKIDAAKAELATAEQSLAAAEEKAKQAAAASPTPAADATGAQAEAPADTAAETTPAKPAQSDPEAIKAEIESLKANVAKLKEHVDKVVKEMPAFLTVMAADEAEPKDLPVHIRGNHLALEKEVVLRRMPKLLSEVAPPPELPKDRSGRLELARWLTSIDHPLTARVLVNRVWMWHFGEALVRTPSNFGLQSQAPTHPELLDWLARQWAKEGWSLKQLHRLIMLSSTYQMASDVDPSVAADYAAKDPENRLLHRQNRRRLEAEPIRDSVLAVGGGLDMTLGGRAPDTAARRRAVYLPINRAALYEMFSTFDYVETANHIEQRPTTTVPHQALFLLNSPLVHEQADRIARGIERHGDSSLARIDSLFWLLYSRGASPAETQRALTFLEAARRRVAGGPQGAAPADPKATLDSKEQEVQAWAALCRAMMAANEFVYID